MFRSPSSFAPRPSPRFLLLTPFSVDSVPSVLKSSSYTSSELAAAPSLFSFFCKKSAKLTPLFSISCALFKKECFANFFTISSFRTLLQNTGVYLHSQPEGFPCFPQLRLCARTAIPATQLFSYICFTVLWIPGWGGLPLSFVLLHRFYGHPTPKADTPCQLSPSCINSSVARIVPPNRRLEAST